jgi:hypothetical protein
MIVLILFKPHFININTGIYVRYYDPFDFYKQFMISQEFMIYNCFPLNNNNTNGISIFRVKQYFS